MSGGAPSGIVPQIRVWQHGEKCFCIFFFKRAEKQAFCIERYGMNTFCFGVWSSFSFRSNFQFQFPIAVSVFPSPFPPPVISRYTHSIRFPSGSSTTLSKYPSPEVRGSPAMVYPSERICSVKRNTSSWLGKVKAKCVSPTCFLQWSVLYICTTHQFQVCSLSKRDKIGLESFAWDYIIFRCFPPKNDIELL